MTEDKDRSELTDEIKGDVIMDGKALTESLAQ